MAKKNEMRVKEVGATINLGNYSSLHVTIGEPSEFAGLDIGRAENYLRAVAQSVNGMLNLPEKDLAKPKSKKKDAEIEKTSVGEKVYSFGSTEFAYYDHAAHSYTSEDGVRYCSVTQMLELFYPFNPKGVIKKEYMDFASSFGNMIHTAIQNAVIGMAPAKKMVSQLTTDVLEAMGKYDKAFVEQVVILPEQEIAGRFDILTEHEGKNTLWDVKTNADIFAKVDCCLPDSLKEVFGKYWNVETTFGEHCLQLNIYAFIIEKTTGRTIDDIKIIHVPDGFKEVLSVPKVDISQLFQAFGEVRSE